MNFRLLLSAGLKDNGAEMGITTNIPCGLNGYDEYGISSPSQNAD
jgi:hypothetical protein